MILDELAAYRETELFFNGEEETYSQFVKFITDYPRCFERSLKVGHLTASCWLWNKDETACLFTLHKKLGMWLQLGGHADGEKDLLKVALTEAKEESGIESIQPLSKEIFDLSIHEIPARKNEPAHLHYDVRYLLKTHSDAPFVVSHESEDLKWIKPEEFDDYQLDSSILKMREKIRFLRSKISL